MAEVVVAAAADNLRKLHENELSGLQCLLLNDVLDCKSKGLNVKKYRFHILNAASVRKVHFLAQKI
jgi:hypothetical protein